jgi:branched-chain amino acid aminotransferase
VDSLTDKCEKSGNMSSSLPKEILVNINGQLMSADQAKVSAFDRSYLYGDSLYEVARTYHGEFFGLDEHLERMTKSAELCHMVLSQKREEYRREILRTHAEWKKMPANRGKEAYCRIVVSRGEGRIGFGLSCLVSPTLYTIIVQPLEPPTAELFKKGYHFQVAKRLRNDPRALDPAMKSGNYLNSLLAYLEAASEEYDDALLCNQEGHVTEGTTFNIFYIRRGIIATPPLDIGILDGITRRETILCAKELGFEVREVRFPKERLYEADEVFMTSSIKEVFPVTRIDGRKIGDGTPGKLTRQLRTALEKRIDQRTRRSAH